VVDEVLAVGDAEFQKKAIGKMQDISHGDGRTVLFVSHNMDAMLNLCHKGIFLENGQIKHVSNIQDPVNYYLGLERIEGSYHCKESSKPIYISDVEFIGTKENRSGLFSFDKSIRLKITIKRREIFNIDKNCILGVALLSQNGTKLFTVEKILHEYIDGMQHVFNVTFPNKLISPGKYKFLIAIHIPNIQVLDTVQDICNCTIFDSGTEYLKYNGVNNGYFIVEAKWETDVK
jgi:lipopolysaccharide transport system ATP-binding protein